LLRFRRARAISAAAVVGAATLGGLFSAGTAGAAGSKITCTKLTGAVITSITLKGCSGNTGGASTTLPSTVLATGGTITWVNGKTTTVVITIGHAETDPTETMSCPVTSSEFELTGTVTADTTGSAPVGGLVKSEQCQDIIGHMILEPGTALKLK
jgi:hypothetical protein